jgi:hypothetical protein
VGITESRVRPLFDSDAYDSMRKYRCASTEPTIVHYDQNCYKLATLAIGYFRNLGEEGRKLLGAMAEEWATKEAAPGSAKPRALKGIRVSRIRAALSASW